MSLPTSLLLSPDLSSVPHVFARSEVDYASLASFYTALGYSDMAGDKRLSPVDFVSRVLKSRFSSTEGGAFSVSVEPPVAFDTFSYAKFMVTIENDFFFRKWKAEIAKDPELVGYLLGFLLSSPIGSIFNIEHSTSAVEEIAESYLWEDEPDFSEDEARAMLSSGFRADEGDIKDVARKLLKFGIKPELLDELSEVVAMTNLEGNEEAKELVQDYFDEDPIIPLYIADTDPIVIETDWVESKFQHCMEVTGILLASSFTVILSPDPLEAIFQFDQISAAINKSCEAISQLLKMTTVWALDAQ